MEEKNNFEFLTDEEILEKAKPKNEVGRLILKNILIKFGELGELASVARYLKVSRPFLYRALEERKILSVKIGVKRMIVIRSILNIVD
ncbi:hypothetical protein [Fusobacterium sp. FSA-380-WT-3A]|uniref:hypothetical protein n=1 Tax=Fusobacterium sp. FSA-380-WT-3A TaxID=2725304 RepID=UPI001476F206|nr:hypothetical protein [Fusobacterium sp. FSA-380-WT-3A]NME36506.1 helix-turn-helix domain-containing protein [Fusobacterium sp. FSA-380-WT-3A]